MVIFMFKDPFNHSWPSRVCPISGCRLEAQAIPPLPVAVAWVEYRARTSVCNKSFGYFPLFTCCVSGRGNRIGPVRLSFCLSVCVSVSALRSWQKDFGAKELYNTGRGRCVNAQAFSLIKSFFSLPGWLASEQCFVVFSDCHRIQSSCSNSCQTEIK